MLWYTFRLLHIQAEKVAKSLTNE